MLTQNEQNEALNIARFVIERGHADKDAEKMGEYAAANAH